MRPRPARASAIESARPSRSESWAGTARRRRRGDRRGHRREDVEDVAPARPPCEHHLDGRGRGHRAETPEAHEEAVDERPPAAREPDRDRLERGHEPAREADPDEGPPEGERRERLGGGEDERPGGGDEEERALDPAGPVAVEQDPEGELEEPEAQEIGGGQEPEVSGPEPEFPRDRRADDRVDRTVEVGEKVARPEGEADHRKERNRAAAMGRRTCVHPGQSKA